MSTSINSQEDNHTSQRFGLKHAAALLFAIAVPALIYVFREQVRELQYLGYLGGFLTMLIGNATVILPVPGLIVVFALGSTLNPLLLGLVSGPGAALGELVGYFAGFSGSGVIENTRLYQNIERWVRRYGPLVIAVLAAIPNPAFDIAGLISGALGIRWWKFLLAAWLGKTIQAIVIAYAGAFSVGWVEQLLR
ncbi:MAG: VTT domain-containing protein [Anaerolineae bacterium]|nr:VTT domain-containing protein [Anaerolineae bacterium]